MHVEIFLYLNESCNTMQFTCVEGACWTHISQQHKYIDQTAKYNAFGELINVFAPHSTQYHVIAINDEIRVAKMIISWTRAPGLNDLRLSVEFDTSPRDFLFFLLPTKLRTHLKHISQQRSCFDCTMCRYTPIRRKYDAYDHTINAAAFRIALNARRSYVTNRRKLSFCNLARIPGSVGWVFFLGGVRVSQRSVNTIMYSKRTNNVPPRAR